MKKLSAEWAAIIVTVCGLFVTLNYQAQSRICEFRTKTLDETLERIEQHQFFLQYKMDIPNICYMYNGTSLVEVKGKSNWLSPMDIQNGIQTKAQMEKTLLQKIIFLENLLKPSEILKNLSGATILANIKIANYFELTKQFSSHCGEDAAYHEIYRKYENARGELENELFGLNKSCFFQLDIGNFFPRIIKFLLIWLGLWLSILQIQRWMRQIYSFDSDKDFKDKMS